jgi:hypothetical protein
VRYLRRDALDAKCQSGSGRRLAEASGSVPTLAEQGWQDLMNGYVEDRPPVILRYAFQREAGKLTVPARPTTKASAEYLNGGMRPNPKAIPGLQYAPTKC